jgi:hypothetical protein
MKIVLYMDVYPGMNVREAWARANPTEITPCITRYRIVVDIPDPKYPTVVSAKKVKVDLVE